MSSNTFVPLKDILDKSRKFFEQSGLKPFLLSLPLQGPSAESNKDGIREKILKNRSQLAYELNSEEFSTTKKTQTLIKINEIVNRLTDYETVGFVLLITEYIGDESKIENSKSTSTPNQHRPVAGGIVEFVDEYERSIRAMWCRRSLSNSIVELICQVMTLQIIACSFNCEHPNSTTKQRVTNKLLSVVDQHCITFPREAYNFLTSTTGLNLGKHWETPEHGGNHNDSPLSKCQCQKLSNKEKAFQFWGISETRFISYWNSRKENLIPNQIITEMQNNFLNLKRRILIEDSENQKNSGNKVTKRRAVI